MDMPEQQQKKGPGLLEQGGAKRAQTTMHDEMIPQAKKTVKRANWLKEFHVQSGLSSAEIVELIRPLFPGFDKPLLVKCENPDKYGIQLSQKAMRRLKEAMHDERSS
ncbi:MAG: hypothetical protein IKP40_13620 [Clostridia bacterium]|nr:hypothetical protein [Clostridia bacterium]